MRHGVQQTRVGEGGLVGGILVGGGAGPRVVLRGDVGVALANTASFKKNEYFFE